MKKRIIAVLITCITLACAIISPFPGSISARAGERMGDITNDGAIDSNDYLYAKRIILGTYTPNDYQLTALDLDGNGVLDAYDYLYLKRMVLGTYTYNHKTNYVNVSAGKIYTLSAPASKTYPDSHGCELTDGVDFTANDHAAYTDERFCGFDFNPDITLDLGTEGRYLNRFELSYLCTTGAGINVPGRITVYGSDAENGAWKKIGEMQKGAYRDDRIAKAVLEPQSECNYRYIRFSAERKSGASWVFISEISVYANLLPRTNEYDPALNAYKADTTTDAQRTSNLNSVSGGKSHTAAEDVCNSVSAGADITVDCARLDTRVSQDIKLLTDGAATGATFGSNAWVGISAESESNVVIDLGEVCTDICSFRVHCLNRPASLIRLPGCVDIAVSKDGKTFTDIARGYTPKTSQTNYTVSISLPKLASARYIRFTMPAGKGYYWFEEISVLAHRPAPEQRFVYGDLDMEFGVEEKFHPAGDADYNDEINLVSGRNYQIVSELAMDEETYSKDNTSESDPLLTDGYLNPSTSAGLNCYNGKWFHFRYGDSRRVYFDLGAESAVTGFSARFLRCDRRGVYAPSKVRFALSENGTDWYVVGEKETSYTKADEIITVEATLDSALRARYAMVLFAVNDHVFADEFTVSGKKNTFGVTSVADSGLESVSFDSAGKNAYQAPGEDILGGTKDIALIYHNIQRDDRDFFLPYVGYVDEDGNVKDTMFDGYLFLPSTSALPSGGHAYGKNVYTDWLALYDDIFAAGQGLSALDSAAQQVKTKLGLSELKLKVFLTIPHMDESVTDFGDADGDGVTENLSSLDERVKVATLYADKLTRRFESGKYKNLSLCGFYWFHESIDEKDAVTARAVNEAFGKQGRQMFWIPYFLAKGYSEWESFGFTSGCLQPNYAFHENVSERRLYDASELAKKHGMSIELEIDEKAFSDIRFFKKYMDYMSGGVKYGYMNESIHMYYQGTDIFRKAAESEDARIRLIYDYTYRFIKATLELAPQAPAGELITADKDTALSGTLDNDKGRRVFRLGATPAHGSVTLTETGEYVYYPNKGFTGTDSFTYTVSNYLGVSESVTVEIKVS